MRMTRHSWIALALLAIVGLFPTQQAAARAAGASSSADAAAMQHDVFQSNTGAVVTADCQEVRTLPGPGRLYGDDVGTVVERDGTLYLRERHEVTEWVWRFPTYVGNLGIEASTFGNIPHDNGNIGLYYRHLVSDPGPLFFGFEIMPFAFGTIYDDADFPAFHSYQGRAQGLMRLYFDVPRPRLYVELGLGVQFTAFTAADEFAVIVENDSERDSFARWRASSRLSFGVEWRSFGLEIGWTGLFPAIEFDYMADTRDEIVDFASVGGLIYVALTVRFSRDG